MTCSNCAKEYNYELYCCPNCGEINEPGPVQKNKKAVAGFILSFGFVVTLILGIIFDFKGAKEVVRLDGAGKKLNKWGFIIAFAKVAIYVIVGLLFATGVINLG